jgi:glycosyltransferase involved in cell wall biosynthesis
MKLALDARMVGWGGVGEYIENLIQGLQEYASGWEILILINKESLQNKTIRNISFPKVILRAPVFSFHEQVELPMVLLKNKIALLHAPHFITSVVKVTPLVVTLHDLIPLIYPKALNKKFYRHYYILMNFLTSRLAERIITVSYRTKLDLCQLLRVPPEKIRVIYPSINQEYFSSPKSSLWEKLSREHHLPENYILYVGVVKPHKNLLSLLQAYELLLQEGFRAKLVVVGKIDQRFPEIRALHTRYAKQVNFIGELSREKLTVIYKHAQLLILPSFYEGFGLPVVEAMSCGVPVGCSKEGALPEITQGAALLFDPANVKEIKETMKKLVLSKELRVKLIKKGLERSQRFKKERFIKETLSVYTEVLYLASRVKSVFD